MLIGLTLAAIALARRRVRLALAVPLMMLAASATTELLKPAVGGVRSSDWIGAGHQIGAASWPSGHATAAMMVALCAVLVAPPLLRPLVALLGSVLAVGVSYSILMLGWHFPSDVLGGFLVAGMWVSLSLTLLWWSRATLAIRREIAVGRAEPVRSLLVPGALGAVGAGVAFALLAAHGVSRRATFRRTPRSFSARSPSRPSLLSGSDRGPTAAPRRRLPPAPG